MVAFCNEVLDQIFNVQEEGELKRVIHESVEKFRNEKSSNHEGTYIMNMIVRLRIISPPSSDVQRIEIVRRAIAIFGELQRHLREPII